MNLYEVNVKVLQRELGVEEIPELFVVMAKHQVMGLEQQQIADTLSCELGDVLECEQDTLYKRVKAFIGAIHSEQTANQTTGWDALESIAVEKLVQRVQNERDTDTLLRIATMANRASRKHEKPTNVLDPAARAGVRTITLTQRLVSKISSRGERTQEEIREVSIGDGSMANPSFAEIDSLLTVRNSPVLPHATEIRTHQAEISVGDLVDDMLRR